MVNLLEKLNPEQLKAVTHKDGPLLIVAGAGTGKTTVIARRIACIIERDWAKSDEILALTFTEKAAGEMEERVDKLLPMGYLDLWISTFHSFGERILKQHGLEIGLPPDFKLLNEFEQWALVKKNLDKFDLDYYRPLGNPAKFIHVLIKHFSRVKDDDISPADYLEYADGLKENLDGMLSGTLTRNKRQNTIAEQEIMRINEVANAYHVYQQLLLDNNALDFGDLINYCLKLFKDRPAILEKYRKQFKFILLDEFQDTNWAQYELIKMLTAPRDNLVVVGDDDQAIFRFRGASMSNILQFKKDYPESKEIVLVKNYRNTQNILNLSYKFIQLNNPNRLEYQLNKVQSSKFKVQKLNKKLLAEEKDKGVIELIFGSDLHDEIRQVIEKIADLKIKSQNEDTSWNDFAILVRANESAKNFCNALDIAGLPYQFMALRGLYAKPVIMDVTAYLKMLDNYHESPALYRILNLPIFNFSYQELVNFNYAANKKAWSLWTVLRDANAKFGKEAQLKIDKVLNLISKHTALVRDKSAGEIVMAFLTDSGYLKYLTSQEERKSREAANLLNQFMKRIQVFEAGSDDKSVKAFLAELNMEIDSGEQGSLAPDIEAGPEAIKIMTVHAAKGLEFKYIFIANMVDKRFPTIERKEQILIPDALIKEILPVGDIHLEEERRLFYVAMTRAKQSLYFSWAEDYGGARKKKPSRFLMECGLVRENTKTQKHKNTKTQKHKNIYPPKLQRRQTKTTVVDFQRAKIHKQESENIAIQIPNYFSYTQLAAFSNCPYQYRFAHVLKVPRQGKAVFSFGKTMHLTLQKAFELVNEKKGMGQADLFGEDANPPAPLLASGGAKIDFNEILQLYKQSWIDDWYESKSQKDKYKKKGKEILKEFYQKHKDNWPNAIFLEKGFNIKLGEAEGEVCPEGEVCEPRLQGTIRGMIDRIDEADGQIKIIDYKTGKAKDKLSFNEKEQLLIYQLAAQDLFKQEIKSLAFYYLDNNSEIEFLGSENELEKVKQKIITVIKEIKKAEFLPKPSQLCKYCDFYDICEFRQN
ncbi:MAG: UvrD-helicase domain-containing protein [Patescibacteria group bacterium]|nr:UvrD-helicase domain-containing protein [Patescibacteria group bacterium]